MDSGGDELPDESGSAAGRAGRRPKLVAVAVAVAIAVAVVISLAMPRGLFSGDEGIKLAQIQGLVASRFTDAALYDPGARYAVDRRHEALTKAPGFTRVDKQSGKVYGTYPLLYAALAVPFYWAGGAFAVPWLSLLALAIALVLTARLARVSLGSDASAAAVVAVVALSSPLLLYGGLVIEHTASVAALLGAIALLVGQDPPLRRLAASGALYALATCFRTELYAFAPSMALILAWRIGLRPSAWRRWCAFAAGAVVVVGLFLVAHRLATPFWHPTLAVSTTAPPSLLRVRFIQLVPRELYEEGRLLVLATLAAAVVAMAPGRARRPVQLVLTAAATAAWGFLAFKAVRAVDGDHVRTVTGLLTTTPIAVLALLRGVDRRERESPIAVFAAAALAFAAVVVLVPKRGSAGGLELGSRYMLPILPLLAIAAIDHARRHWVHGACAVALVGLGVWASVANVRSEHRVRALGAHVIDAIEEPPADAMFTPVWWVAQLAVPAQDRTCLYVGSASTRLYDRLFDAGLTRIAVLRGKPPAPAGRIRFRPLGPSPVGDPRVSPRLYELYDPSGKQAPRPATP
jgi:hypothetical protein